MRWMTGWTSRLAQAAAAAAALTTAPLITQATAQIDMRTGLHLDDRNPAAFYKDYPGYGSNNATVGVGPGGVATAGPRQRCHMETTTTERHEGRRITHRERRCD